MKPKSALIEKVRLDALTDGVFAVAMTLLVIDLRLPESFHPKDDADLLRHLGELGTQVIVYVVSFYVLSLRWTNLIQIAPRGETLSPEYVWWAMLHLLFVTFVPFTTMLVGRHISLAPAIWLYAANTILFAFVAMRMIWLTDHDEGRSSFDDQLGLVVLVVASLLAVAISLVAPQWAMLGFLLNLIDGPLRIWMRRRRPTAV